MATTKAASRITRELDNRELTERPKAWRPPELLPEPDKEAGYSYRWIRVSMLNQPDPRNLSAKLREGWEPVRIEEQPKFKLLVDPDGRYKDNIEIGGLLLCKTPTEFVEQQQKYYADMTRMPIFKEGKSTSSFGKGN